MAEDRTIIGSTIQVRGSFTSEEDVVIEGRVEGQIQTTADLYVSEGGVVQAEVQTRNIDVRGKVIGNVRATDRFEIHPGGEVHGDISAPRVVLADGAKYKGHIDMKD